MSSGLPPMPSATGAMEVLICKRCGLMAAKHPKVQALNIMGVGHSRYTRAQLCDGGPSHHTQVIFTSGDERVQAGLLLPPGNTVDDLSRVWLNLGGKAIGWLPSEGTLSYVPLRVRRRPSMEASLAAR